MKYGIQVINGFITHVMSVETLPLNTIEITEVDYYKLRQGLNQYVYVNNKVTPITDIKTWYVDSDGTKYPTPVANTQKINCSFDTELIKVGSVWKQISSLIKSKDEYKQILKSKYQEALHKPFTTTLGYIIDMSDNIVQTLQELIIHLENHSESQTVRYVCADNSFITLDLGQLKQILNEVTFYRQSLFQQYQDAKKRIESAQTISQSKQIVDNVSF
jgi:hypothetical protein